MRCIDCKKKLTEFEEVKVILSIQKIPRCRKCYWAFWEKKKEKLNGRQTGQS